MPEAIFNANPKPVFFNAEVREEHIKFKLLLDSVRRFGSLLFNPDFVEAEGKYKLRGHLAADFVRHYRETVLALSRSALAIISKADNVLVAHKAWLRLQFEEERRVGVSTRIERIGEGVVSVHVRREHLSELRQMLEGFEENFRTDIQDIENSALECPATGLVDWDVGTAKRKANWYESVIFELSELM